MNTPDLELKYLRSLFFLFGFLIMAWLPRFPEIKDNLGLTNGQFGSLTSTGAIGSFVSLMTVGHLVHKIGVKIVLQLSAIVLSVAGIILVSTHSTLIYLIFNIVWGAAMSAFHISINTQGFSFQDRNSKLVITQLSGIWSTGALATSVVAGLLIDRMSIELHITLLSGVIGLSMLYVINLAKESLVKPNDNPETDYKFLDVFRGFKVDVVVSAGLICALMLEFSIGDWASIFVKEDLSIKGSFNTLPYILFTMAMIGGRLTVHRLFGKHSIEKLARVASISAATAFVSSIWFLKWVGTENKVLVITVISIGFTIAGVGLSFLGPSFMSAANARSDHPSAVVIGQIGVVNILLVFVLRWIIAWTSELTSLAIGLMIPALMLLMVPIFAKVLKNV